MLLSVTTKAGKQAEITLTENNNRMSSVVLVTVDGKEIKGDWRLEGKLVKNYTNKIAIELKEENLSQISAENLKIAKVSYSNRYLSLVSNDEGYFAVKEAMKNTCSTLSEVEQVLGGKEMLVSELIAKLESKLQDYDVVETVETVVEFTAKNYDEEQDGNFERKEYKVTKKTLVKKVEKIETVKEEKKEITEAKTEENQDSEIEEMEEIEVNGIHCIEKELEKEIEDNKIAYYNENSNWYLINDNYKDAETIEEEEIDLTQYKIVKIESSETGNNEVDEGFWVWEAENGVWFLEEEGYFKKFESLEKLIKQFEFDKNLREEEVEYYDFNASVNYDEFN